MKNNRLKKGRLGGGARRALAVVCAVWLATASGIAFSACQKQLPYPDGGTGESSAPSTDGMFGGEDGETDSESSVPNGSVSDSADSGNSGDSGGGRDEEKPPKAERATYIVCTGSGVHIRSGAGRAFASLGKAEKGNMYAVLGSADGWVKIGYRNQVAYLANAYAAPFTIAKTENEKIERTIAEGYRLLGVPYVYGAVRLHDGSGRLLKGFSAQKMDCSSLIQYVFYHGAGVLLQVTTRTQVVQGRSVSKADLRRGDCMYFTNEERQYRTGIERVGHVALYLGEGYILHTSSDYARIEKMTAARWKFFLEARRFI